MGNTVTLVCNKRGGCQAFGRLYRYGAEAQVSKETAANDPMAKAYFVTPDKSTYKLPEPLAPKPTTLKAIGESNQKAAKKALGKTVAESVLD